MAIFGSSLRSMAARASAAAADIVGDEVSYVDGAFAGDGYTDLEVRGSVWLPPSAI